MWGFWREAGYITAYKTLPLWLWYSITFIFVITMLIGYYSNPNKKSKFFYSLWWVGLIFATGASHPYTAPLFNFLFKYLPFFNGFRDSHKFVVFIVLAYAYLCPAGLYWIRDKLKQFTSNLRFKQLIYYGVPIIFVGIIILYTYPLIGLWGQIKLCEYPESYKETGLFLEFKNITGYIIYLPWEGYLTYNWTIECTPDGRIAVPINKFIQPIAIVSQGKWGYSNSLTNNINTCLINKSITCLEDIGVQYIIKDNCAYYPYAYSWINKTSVHTDRCTQIYQIDNKLKIDRVIKFPLRFIIGFVISFLTFVYLLFIISQKSN